MNKVEFKSFEQAYSFPPLNYAPEKAVFDSIQKGRNEWLLLSAFQQRLGQSLSWFLS